MQVLLRNYLSGHTMQQGILLFERALGPFVKQKVQKHFADTPAETKQRQQLLNDRDERQAIR